MDEPIELTRRFAQWPWGSGLYLFGSPGCGKTLLAALTMRGMLISGREYGWPVVDGVRTSWENFSRGGGGHITFWQPIFRFVNTPRLLHDIKNTFTRMSKEEPDTDSVITKYETADALVIDDIGREKPTDWVRETLFLLIDARYNAKRPTIFTSNYHPRELAERLSEPIADRILEMCSANFVHIDVGSYRG